MVNITLSIPEEIRIQMEKFAWLNWSAIAREAFLKRIKQLQILEKFEKDFEKSELTDEDCINIGRKLKEDKSKEEQELIKWSVDLGRRAKKDSFKRLLSELSPKEREKLLGSMSSKKREEYE